MFLRKVVMAVFAVVFLQTGAAQAAKCGNNASGYEAWKAAFIKEAPKYRLRSGMVASTLKGVTYNKKVIRLDRNQKSFKLSFNQFYAKRVNNAMINKAKRLETKYQRLFNRIEKNTASLRPSFCRSGGWKQISAATPGECRSFAHLRLLPMIAAAQSSSPTNL
ncbi:lytic murein transglycosylase [Roseibium sp. TrichSKD4]|nr:lytic murein transglycosylase [Roseibium sp. TrichSKD4]EFO29801.1 lytic murein transglycosylase [Roseibium sp. TrichSKD4]